MISITPEEVSLLSKYVVDITGIKLDPQKGYLLESRFQPLINDYQCSSFKELYQKSLADRTGSLMNQMIDAITTNETYFFRDSKPFELMSHKIIPDLIDRRRKESGSDRFDLRIWSAACSTGQEIYSIGIALHEMLPDIERFKVTILGTDISDGVIAKASYGSYNRFEVERGLSDYYREKYFTKTANGWRIKDIIRTMVRFEKRDLNKPFTELGKFDLVFCRNVAIYFDIPDKIRLFQKISRSLRSGGVLIVGASESLSGIADDFIARHYLKSLYYQLKKESDTVPVSTAETMHKAVTVSDPQTQPTRTIRPPSVNHGTVSPANPTISVEAVQRKPVEKQIAASKKSPSIRSIRSTPVSRPVPDTQVLPSVPAGAAKIKTGIEKPGRSLLASIQHHHDLKKSLLSKITSEPDHSKKSLLNDIRDHSKTDIGQK
ncbi:protein-glutamate O-methyltransferase CheR [bacterium]|nr:protein-glutamate O-methyltransferase CheR [bacterium]